uniref:Phosphatidylinositol N-acetylglucosaminyltransferase subunit C n=1 Tax=Auxenochlorella protothecoides TaxID=3075 RepID=A0A1D2A9G7_AUXPR
MPPGGDPPPPPPSPWQKVLYKEQPWPDNYTSPAFLESLVVNDRVPVRSYARVVSQACPVLEQLATVCWVGALTHNLYTGRLTSTGLLLRCALFSTAGWALIRTLAPAPAPLPADPRSAAAAMLQLAAATALMSPLYSTLTLSISSDTVLACVLGLALAHLYLADYRPASSGPAASLQGSLSLAAILAAAILVASRLRDVADVAAQLLLSLLAFVLAPYARRQVGAAGAGARAALTAGTLAGAGAAVWGASRHAGALFALAVVFLGVLCPLWLVRAHKFKAKINGPWDEAVPRLGQDMREA